jgi:hypothetical protein
MTLPRAVALLLLVACQKANPHFCEGAPNNNCDAIDAAIDGPRRCDANGECAAPTSVCDVTDTHTCVECTAASHDACTGTTPTCVANACAPCTSHAQCASAACLPDGSCADPANVAYVQGGGSGTACTQTQQCGTLDIALKTSRPVVKVNIGTVEDTITTTINRKVTIVAEPGAKLDRANNGVILSIESDEADVAISDLEITGATGTGNPAISVQIGGAPKLSLNRVKIDRNQGAGITTASAATLTVTRSELFTNDGPAINMLVAGTIVFINNLVHHNGRNTGTPVGGLALIPAAGSRVEFNTIVDNTADTGASSVGGVSCNASFAAPNNILFRNKGGSTGIVQSAGTCDFAGSYRSGVETNDPGFADPMNAPYDYHLTSTTPATILDAAGACTVPDFAGLPRPVGAACDRGAYEFRP